MTGETHDNSRLHRLIYASRATPTTAAKIGVVLSDIVRVSQLRNKEAAITGALLACDGWFLQVLEGARSEVWRTYTRIGQDYRHKDIYLLKAEPLASRQFPDWYMCGQYLSPTDEAIIRAFAGRQVIDPEKLSPALAVDLLFAVRDAQLRTRARAATSGRADGGRPVARG